MRNLLALVGLVVVVFAVVGWYRGWYNVHASTPGSGHGSYHIDLNTPKISDDLSKGREKLRDILTKDNNAPPATPVSPAPPSNQVSNQRPVAPPPAVPPYRTGSDGAFVYPGAEESGWTPVYPNSTPRPKY